LPLLWASLEVDQLEELFTTGFSPEIQEKYVSAVSGLARSGRVFIIATLRNDFYARYQEFPDLVDLAKESRFDLPPPGADEIRAIIQQPAEAAGLSFERHPESGESLDEALSDAAIKNPESLPLLEHALDQLFQAQAERRDNLLRWSDYRALGGVEGALAKHAEATFEKLHPHEQGAFPVVMGQLVTLGRGEEEVPNRRSSLYSDFSAAEAEGKSRAGAQGFIDLFVKNRLLMADTDASGNVVISVAHEALLRHWTRVREWLAVNREFLRMRDRLDANLQIWKGRGRQKADLLQSGLPLAEGEKLDDVAKKAKEYFDRLPKELMTPSRLSQQADLLNNLGDVLVAQGKLPEALEVYQQGLAIARHLIEQDKANGAWQRDLAMSYEKIGEVLTAERKLAEALDAHQQSLKIRQVLAEQDKTNGGWQRDLAMSYDRIGEVLEAQGKLPEALDAYRHYFDISDMLASRTRVMPPGRTVQLGADTASRTFYLRIKDGDRNEARRLVAEGIEIMKRLGRHAEMNATLKDLLNKLNGIANMLGLSSRDGS
jgi:tetratricopeptide (TPR) repeat protein